MVERGDPYFIPDAVQSPPPQPEPEQFASEEQPEQESKPGWEWIGSPSRPEVAERSDGISDLFTVDDDDLDAGEGVDDLVEVDMERDILDADEGTGDLSDLVDVTDEDIMGNEEYGQRPSKPASQQRRSRNRIPSRYQPPTSMGRSG